MEESENRKERLKAMRMEAAASSSSCATNNDSLQQTTTLSNPLLENQQPSPTQPSRFDFYTDPMSAFSSHKHLPLPSHKSLPPPSFPPGSRNSEMSHSGVDQFQNSFAPYQNVHQGGGVPYYSPGPMSSPMGMRSPYNGNQSYSPSPTSSPYHGHQSYSPDPIAGPVGFRSPFPVHQGRPTYRGPQFQNCPSPGSGSPYPVHQGSLNLGPPTQGRGSWQNNCPSPSYGRGRGSWQNNCPSPSHGRGRGQWEGGRMSPSGGRGRGRAFDSQGRSYYDKSMVEDPWEFLTPVMWQADNDDDEESFSNIWSSFKKASYAKGKRGSVRMNSDAKKTQVSNKEPSLAEFLAAAADEAGEDDAGTVP